MHPEIKKFWEKAGYTIIVDILKSDLWRFYWVFIKDGLQVKFAGISAQCHPETKDTPCVIHFLNDKEYSEDQMLRIIKLKVFI